MGEGGGVLLHVGSGAYHGVNEIGALIWGLVPDGLTFAALIDELRTRLEDSPADLADEVTVFIQELVDRELLEVREPGSDAGQG